MTACVYHNQPVEPTGTSRSCQRAFAAPWRLVPAAHRQRYMRTIKLQFWSLLFSFLAGSVTAYCGPAEEPHKAPVALSNAPTGTYVAYMDPQKGLYPVFTLQLRTNGTYFAETGHRVPAQDGDLVRLLPETARGTWRWDAEKREFRLEPGKFKFYIERLPADKQNTNRLVWGSSWLVREGSR